MARLELVKAASPATSQPVADLLAAERKKDLLRFLTCGSVDDGKSTLIGRLLYDSKLVYDDQLAGLASDSKRTGTAGGDLDFALLIDGLQAEREQGITIDVAYRYFSTPKRKFIVADTPGHEQYTRNMATGASTCDFAVLLVDARQGILAQTRRHACIVSLLGIRKLALAVNKMDLVGFARERFETIAQEFVAFGRRLGFEDVVAIPLSALRGDNVIAPGANMHWYRGPTLMGHLETVDVTSAGGDLGFRMPVQWVNRAEYFRGYAGMIAGGTVRAGDDIAVLPSGRRSRVERIVTYDGDLDAAATGDAVTLTLADEIDVSRGNVLAAAGSDVAVSDQIAAHVVWMAEEPLLPGRAYVLKSGAQATIATITELKHKINVDTLEHQAGKTLELNEVGFCNLSLSQPLVFDPYKRSRAMGGFILIDRFSDATLGAGMVEFGLRRATNIKWQAMEVGKDVRAGLKGQTPCVLWLTGLSGAGKSTVANLVEKQLAERGRHTYVLDGDNVRHGLNKDLGFTDADRVENVRRVAETARLLVDAGLIVIVSLISPFRSERRMARELFEAGEFIEVFVDTPLEVCEARDPKGLYKKARAGMIKNFTGIDSDYEPPDAAELRLRAGVGSPEALARDLIGELERRKFI
ncbi:MAG: sulfate adenylyltransferase subunit CysN [Alphaproteobacteria bacterium]|nr:MAG: sulfate adenylyltransferase subunit CysN [Alphaproteobacteria bacterium]